MYRIEWQSRFRFLCMLNFWSCRISYEDLQVNESYYKAYLNFKKFRMLTTGDTADCVIFTGYPEIRTSLQGNKCL